MPKVVTQNYRNIEDADEWAPTRLGITLEAMDRGQWHPGDDLFLCPRCVRVMEKCRLVLFEGWHCRGCDGYIGWDYADLAGCEIRGDIYDPDHQWHAER